MDWLFFLSEGQEERLSAAFSCGTPTFSPRCHGDWATAGLASRGAQWHPVPGQQERGLGRERGSILIFMFNGQCFLLVNFQKITHKATTSASVRLNHCSPITLFWGLQILHHRLPTTYSENVKRIHRILINVSGLLYLKLVLFVMWVLCSNKQHEFYHLQVFNPISVMVSKSRCTGMSQKKKLLTAARTCREMSSFKIMSY